MASNRLYFIDALRAFAILMMLQGHFISSLLAPEWQQADSTLYVLWKYCRGFTAPIFFTITGWVFYFLLLRTHVKGWKNPRIKKGLKRVLELLLWGYLLRLNVWGLFSGTVNASFKYPDVLQIIALSVLFVICCYLLLFRNKLLLGIFLGSMGVLIFCLEPLYAERTFSTIPTFLSAYLTKANGGVFYLFPWLGYVCMGAVLGIVFQKNNLSPQRLRLSSFLFFILGILLVFKSSAFFMFLYNLLDVDLFRKIAYNNFLFIRLGDVFVLIAFFIAIRRVLKKSLWVFVGSKTLSLYIVHYFILYGSLTGVSLYAYFGKQLTWVESVVGAILFIIACYALVRFYPTIKRQFMRVMLYFR